MPFAVIQRPAADPAGLDLSVGALVGAVGQVAARADPGSASIRAELRASPVVHADETGWREDGRNGYVWTFSTPRHRFFVRGTGTKRCWREAIGDAFAGVLVSDFYAAYTGYDGRHQYCWAHLLRDSMSSAGASAGGRGAGLGGRGARPVPSAPQAFASADPRLRRRAAQAFQAELAALCAPYLPPAATAAAAAGQPWHRSRCRRSARCANGSRSTSPICSSSSRTRPCRPPTTPPNRVPSGRCVTSS